MNIRILWQVLIIIKNIFFVFKETEIAEKIIYKLRKNTLIDMEVYKEVVDFS